MVTVCDDTSSPGTLRSAIASAAAGDTIAFDCSGTITVTSADGGRFMISKNLTIDGSGQSVTLSGHDVTSTNSPQEVFEVDSGTVTLNDLTIVNGSGIGGGISNAGSLTVTNSTFSNNSSGQGGGAILNSGTLTITNSTFSGNSSGQGGGGGILNQGGTATVSNSTFSGNSTPGHGGAIRSDGGTLTVTNSTFSGNSASNGGGISSESSAIVGLANTILADPSGGDCYMNPNASGTITDNGGNLAGDASCDFTQSSSKNSVTTLNLGTLANNGGPTETIALGSGSAAIGAGLESVCTAPSVNSLDQRGDPRSTTACDSGAYDTDDPITPATVTLSALSQTYDGSPEAAGASASPTTCGPVVLSYSQSGTPVSAPTTAGSYSVQASLSNPECTISSGGTGTLTIEQASLAITPDNQNMTYGRSVPSFTVSPGGYSGLLNGGQPSVVSGLTCGAVDSSNTTVSSSTPAGTDAITCSGGTAANYSITYNTGTLTITPAALTVTANDRSKTYGDTVTFAGTEFTTSGLVNSDTVTSVTLTSAGAAASAGVSGSPYAIVPSAATGTGLGNYSVTYTNGNLTVNPKALTVTASSATVTYGAGVPTISASYSGFAGTEGPASLTSQPTCSTTYTQGGGVGGSPYATSCSGAVSPNYSIGYVNGSVTVQQALQTITFASLSAKVLGSASFTVSATGGASGNPVIFTAGPSTTCTTSGTNGATITVVGVGTCTVTANQAGTANYQAAPAVPQQFTVSYPPLYLVQTLTSSPAGPVTTGSTVMARLTLGNHTTATQMVTLKLTLAYTGSKGSFSLTVPLTFKLRAGQTVIQRQRFTITKLFPRGSYMLSATASDKSGDTATSSATLTVS